MKLFFRDKEVSDSFEDDLLSRGELGQTLLSILKSSDQPVSILLDGPWGSGKSTFLRKFETLAVEEVRIVPVNAFELDYHSDAFIALAGEIIDAFEQKFGADPEKKKKLLKASKRVATVLVRAGVRVASAGLISSTDFDAVGDELVQAASDEIGAATQALLESRDSEKNAFRAFEEAMIEIQSVEEGSKKKQLVIVIDELDRCRPDFALDILESAKHLFKIEGVSFVFSLNKDEFCHSVCARYGSKFDAFTYLQKFFELEIELGFPEQSLQDGQRRKYSDHLLDWSGFTAQSRARSGEVSWYLAYLSEKHRLSLRDMERVITNFLIYELHGDANSNIKSQILLGLAFLRTKKPDLFAILRSSDSVRNEIVDVLSVDDGLPRGRSPISSINWVWSVIANEKTDLRKAYENTPQDQWTAIEAVDELFGARTRSGVRSFTSKFMQFSN